MADRKRLLVTGGAGFIGANFIHEVLEADLVEQVINLDVCTYAACPASLEVWLDDPRYSFVKGDICDQETVEGLLDQHHIDTLVHFAAESHVDRSIDGPDAFIRTNILGTAHLLQAARRVWSGLENRRFHHVSTDEVYGSLGAEGLFREDTPYDPSSPYSASKAGSDHLVRAWNRTYDLPITISNCSNNYGPYQFPEKLIPLIILNALDEKPLPIYGDGRNVRDWLYVRDHCRAIWRILEDGAVGRTYNIGGHNEQENIAIVQSICDCLQERRPRSSGHYRDLITFVADRPGHDRRYAIDASRIADELAWTPQETFASGLVKTVEWYLENPAWWQAIRSGNYGGERLGLNAGS